MNRYANKIKVAMFSYYFPPQYSGAALQAINLARKLRNMSLEVFFFTVNHGDSPASDEVDGFKVFRLREGKGRFGEFLLWKNMWQIIKQQKPDIIHSHGAYLRNSFIGPLSKYYQKKSLIKVSLADNDLHGLGKGKSGWLHERFMPMFDRYASISSKITHELKCYGFPAEKIREIPNGVDSESFHSVLPEEKKNLRRIHGFPLDNLMLLYAGVIDERKNVKWLVEEWEIISRNYPGFLAVVGPVSREDKDMRLYNSLRAYEGRMKNKLFFIPFTDSISDFYKMADIFILPSVNEGMPNVVLEAMSSGLPCLVNKVSGAEDIIHNGNGLFFDIKKPDTFFEGLMRLGVKHDRLRIGEKARQDIKFKYSIERIAEKYILLYEEMLQK
jgi:glycosyltransferase involved in cell wall biosynthesis